MSDSKNPFADPKGPVEPLTGDRAALTEADLQTLQEAGALRQEWIANTESDCPIPRSTLTFRDLGHWHKTYFTDGLPDQVRDKAVELELPNGNDCYWYTSLSSKKCMIIRLKDAGDVWVGHTGPGVLFIEIVCRHEDSTEPHSSEIAKAVYENDFDISELRYVFVVDVQNEQTKHYVETQLYTLDENGWVVRETAVKIWDYGTPQYQSLLGTRIGKMLAYLVLGAFPRGTRRIARIATWYAETVGQSLGDLQIRFDIEKTQ